MNPASGQPTELICGCAAITLARYYEFIGSNPALGFEAVLKETGAGQVCTACLLDLEHHYVRAIHERAPRTKTGRAAGRKARSTSLKRRLYSLVDGVSPSIPYRLRSVAPVLYGGDVTEWLWISNHSMMFEQKVVAPTFRVTMILRNRRGGVVSRVEALVRAGESLRRDLSSPLAAASQESIKDLRVGWLELIRRGEGPGLRGTTRPQFEIEAPCGTCAVHTQAATPPTASGLSLRLRPAEDRTFLTVLNTEAKPLQFRLSIAAPELAAPEQRLVEVAPRGVELIELTLPAGVEMGTDGLLADVSWSANRTFKVHVLYASLGLDQFSVDHA
jgi:hypothetical protein